MNAKKIKEKFTQLLLKYKYIAVVFVIGILLLVIPFGGEKEQKVKEESSVLFSVSDFENRIENIFQKAEGVGRAEVILTLKSTEEVVFEKDKKMTKRGEEDLDIDEKPSVLSDGAGAEAPVIIKRNYPEFQGASVICDGAENPAVKLYIMETITALTNIPSDKITVIKMKR